MSEADLRRLRNDLEMMRQAAGLTLPFDWVDVCLALGLIPAGAIMALWAAFGAEQYLLAGFVPVLLGALASGFWWGKRWRKEGNRKAWRRETTFAWVTGSLFSLGTMTYMLWGEQLGLSADSLLWAGGWGVVSFGLACVVLALSSPARRSQLASALALIPLGLVLPFCSPRQIVIAGGLAVMVAGLFGALIQTWQLRAARRSHERTAD